VKADPPGYVLDSFAVLAYLGDEAGAQRVQRILARARKGQADVWLCLVNYGEVLYIIERKRALEEVHKAIAAIDQLPVQVVQADRALTFRAANVKANFAVSYADAFAIALAEIKGAKVVTGDPEFRKVRSLVNVEWISK